MQVSPDGSHMAFLSATRRPHTSTPRRTTRHATQWREMYVFDPATGEMQCASCLPSGAPPTILKSDIGFGDTGHNYDVGASASGRFMSDDGRVAFSTADALVPRDTNEKIDVYEFVDGRPQLITTGTGDRDSAGRRTVCLPDPRHRPRGDQPRRRRPLLLDLRDAGRPRTTTAAFVKFYDARTGGGFPIRTGAAALRRRGRVPRRRQHDAAAVRHGHPRRPRLGRQPAAEEGEQEKEEEAAPQREEDRNAASTGGRAR